MKLTTHIDGFYLYWALGPERSLEALAERFGLYLPMLRHRARKERWDLRVDGIEGECLATEDETVESMKARHLRMCQLMKARAVEALATLPLPSDVRFSMFPVGTTLFVRLCQGRRRRAKSAAARTKGG